MAVQPSADYTFDYTTTYSNFHNRPQEINTSTQQESYDKPIKPNKKISTILRHYAAQSTMHGLPRVVKSQTTFGRVFWSLVCLAAIGMFILQFAELLTRYFSYQKKVTIEVVPMPVQFPAISMCNMRNLDLLVLNDIANYTSDQKYLHPFIKEYKSFVAKYTKLYDRYKDSHPTLFREVFSRVSLSTNLNRNTLVNASLSMDDFLVTCYIGGRLCNRQTDFSVFFDYYYYNCFTYTLSASDFGEDTVVEGLENGWSSIVLTGNAILTADQNDSKLPSNESMSLLNPWLSAGSNSGGVRVIIHPPNSVPFPSDEGFDVPPGFSASFGIKPHRNIRIGRPWGNCSHALNGLGKKDTGGAQYRYRLNECHKVCLQNEVLKRCKCADAGLPTYYLENATICTQFDLPNHCVDNPTSACLDSLKILHDRATCIRETKAKMASNPSVMESCGCYPACDEVTYDISYSLARWPAGGFENDAAYHDVFQVEKLLHRFANNKRKMELFADYFNVNIYKKLVFPFNFTKRARGMKHLARLNVYIADRNVVKIEESEDYARSQMVSDIGGQLGLWVGVSIVTLTEVFDLLSGVLRFLLYKMKSAGYIETVATQTPITDDQPTRM